MDGKVKETQLKELIKNNNLIELRKWVQENEIKSRDYNNFDDIILYCIDINASVEIVEYILSQRHENYLDFQISGRIPLFIAIGDNNFKIADLLIKKGADINYEVNITFPEIINNFNIISYLKYGILNKKNMLYLLKCNLNSKLFNYLIKMIILFDYDILLDMLFKYYIFDNTFILNLLHFYRNKLPLSSFQLTTMVSKEVGKINIRSGYYEFAERVKNYNALRIFFNNQYGDDNELLDIIIEYNIWTNSLRSKNYNFIKKIIGYKPFYYDKGYTFRSRRKVPFLQAIKSTITPEIINGDLNIGKLIVNTFIKEICNENEIEKRSYNKRKNKDKDTFNTSQYYQPDGLFNTSHQSDKKILSGKSFNLVYFNFILNKIIRMENFELVKYLVDSEDYQLTPNDINTKDIEGKSLIITAANCRKNMDIFNYLIDHGANGNTKDIHYEPLLLRVVSKPKLFKYLLNQPNIDINARNKHGNYPCLEAIRRNETELVKQLIQYANNNDIVLTINQKDSDRDYPLLEAIERNNFRMVQWLLNYASDHHINLYMNKKDVEGNNPLLKAINKENFDIIKLLISYADRHDITININEKSKHGNYPLLVAVMKNNIYIVKQLLGYARVHHILVTMNEKDKYQNYPLLEAIKQNNYDMVKQLMDYARDYNIIINFTEKDKYGDYPLLEAIKKNSFDLTKLLVEYTRDGSCETEIDFSRNEMEWNSLFSEAVDRNNRKIIKLLISFIKDYRISIDINYVLKKSIKQEKEDLIELLIEYANDNKIRIYRETMEYLIKFNKFSQLKMVIKYNPHYLHLKDDDGKVLLNYAYKHKKDKIIDYLKKIT